MTNSDEIRIAEACENNLKHVSLTIPKGKLVVFAGVSGRGKLSSPERRAISLFARPQNGWQACKHDKKGT